MAENTGSNPFDRMPVILAAIALSAIGALLYNILPLFIGVAQDYKSLDAASAGLLGSAFYAGFTASTISAFFWLNKLSWRTVSFAAFGVALIALLLITGAGTYATTLVWTAVAGAAFSIIYGIGTSILAETSQPARWYGAKIATEAAFGALLLYLLPFAVRRWEFDGLIAGVIVALLLVLPLLLGAPQGRGDVTESDDSGLEPVGDRGIWISLIAVFLFMTAATMIWAFLERVANTGGYGMETASRVLSFTLLTAVVGSLFVAWFGDRFGLRTPLGFAVALFVMAAFLLGMPGSLPLFAAGACLLTFAIGMGLPLTVSIVAALDISGRHIVLTVPAIGFAIMVAPAVGGWLIESAGYTVLLYSSCAIVVMALVAAIVATARTRVVLSPDRKGPLL